MSNLWKSVSTIGIWGASAAVAIFSGASGWAVFGVFVLALAATITVMEA